jgi:hypothetical protein
MQLEAYIVYIYFLLVIHFLEGISIRRDYTHLSLEKREKYRYTLRGRLPFSPAEKRIKEKIGIIVVSIA